MLDYVRDGDLRVTDVQTVASILVPNESHDPYWDNVARDLLIGLTLPVLEAGPAMGWPVTKLTLWPNPLIDRATSHSDFDLPTTSARPSTRSLSSGANPRPRSWSRWPRPWRHSPRRPDPFLPEGVRHESNPHRPRPVREPTWHRSPVQHKHCPATRNPPAARYCAWVGGSGVAECAPYLARYFAITAPNPTELFDRRLDFLNLCPASDLPGDVRPPIARYGATCQPSTLVNWLNAQIRSCEIRAWDDSDDCRPTGDEWRMCAPFFDHGYLKSQRQP